MKIGAVTTKPIFIRNQKKTPLHAMAPTTKPTNFQSSRAYSAMTFLRRRSTSMSAAKPTHIAAVIMGNNPSRKPSRSGRKASVKKMT